ncbi:aromatic amino acid transport protein [Escherichia coli]|uniref:Aromatic amino acid transport protein n=1 Tax=Escherichia coli TaxID=562 RepID=A0A2X1JP48_ECOLX|nr:aromatic amino acid transport protein [Escherichia coli]
MMMAIIMFSFGGLELVGITAAEADNPEQSIPKATNQVIYRILIFYIGSLAVLLSLMPWTRVTADTSPFVLIFHELGDTFVGECAEHRGTDCGRSPCTTAAYIATAVCCLVWHNRVMRQKRWRLSINVVYQ